MAPDCLMSFAAPLISIPTERVEIMVMAQPPRKGSGAAERHRAALKSAGAGFYLDPTQHTFTSDDLLAAKAPSAAAVGIVSGLAATGVNQVVKQLGDGK